MQCSRFFSVSNRLLKHVQTFYSSVTPCFSPPHTPDRTNVHNVKDFTRYLTVNSCRRSFCSSGRKCWNCGSSAHLFFCSSCKSIQPPDQSLNYFHIFNCDQIFNLDTQKLQRRFLELQRSLHPDNFSQKSQTEQRYSEEQSALVNKAYRTLQKPLTRSVYMLRLKGVELEEGTDAAADPALLLQVMEFNEKLAEARNLNEVDAVGEEVRATLRNLTEQMNASLIKGDLQAAKELLARMKYFSNLEEKVKEKVAQST
ncbi:iron-sulfur cluster co-chaperone protein HscB [Trichomycterus rosablanca]|uniref:iron-sulfur cluster co-chaperone protein HscB n=1 Tax=Trichomycterus rosablanca TaxID=2290929 RepID=UPI002F3558AD